MPEKSPRFPRVLSHRAKVKGPNLKGLAQAWYNRVPISITIQAADFNDNQPFEVQVFVTGMTAPIEYSGHRCTFTVINKETAKFGDGLVVVEIGGRYEPKTGEGEMQVTC